MPRKRLTLEEVDEELRKIAKEVEELVKTLGSDSAARKMQQGGLIIEARAKEIITEKGHIVTGALRRSINTRTKVVPNVGLETEVGSFMFYAPFVEALPDGGYLAPASEETFDQVNAFVGQQLIGPELRKWGRV